MQPWIIRTSLALDVLVLALCVGLWLGRDQVVLTGSLTTAIFLQSLLPREPALRDELTLDELHLCGEGYHWGQSLLQQMVAALNHHAGAAR